ncbi:hypothetical protein ACLESO_18085 [Pyxidicoccus sp. 3LG]
MFAAKKGKWMAKGLAKSDLYRKWVAHKLIDEIPKSARNVWDDLTRMTCCVWWG